MNRTGRRKSRPSSATSGTSFLQVARQRRRAVAQQVRAAGIEGLDRESERRRSRRRADRAALKDDAIVEAILVNRSLEEIGIRVERLERVDTSRRPNHGGHLHGEEPDVGADVDRRVAGLQTPAHEARLVRS